MRTLLVLIYAVIFTASSVAFQADLSMLKAIVPLVLMCASAYAIVLELDTFLEGKQ